jgi:hypothetical protein
VSLADPGSCVGTFHATWAVLKSEKLLKAAGITVKLVPVPRQISSNCGIAIRFDCSRFDEVAAALSPVRDDLEGFYQPGDGAWRRREPG